MKEGALISWLQYWLFHLLFILPYTVVLNNISELNIINSTSPGFPGNIGISPLEVACAMSTAFEAFARTKPHYVKKIKVVVYEQSITAMFQKNIVQMKGKKIAFTAVFFNSY